MSQVLLLVVVVVLTVEVVALGFIAWRFYQRAAPSVPPALQSFDTVSLSLQGPDGVEHAEVSLHAAHIPEVYEYAGMRYKYQSGEKGRCIYRAEQ